MLPRWSGDVLDLVVDFTTYVFVPAYAIVASGLMPAVRSGCALGLVIAITGALYFADRSMKTADNYFLRLSGGVEPGRILSVAAAADAAGLRRAIVGVRGADLRASAFRAPVSRRRLARPVTVALAGAVGGACRSCPRVHNLEPELWVKAALCSIALYFLVSACCRNAARNT